MEKVFNDIVIKVFEDKKKLLKNQGMATGILKQNEIKLFGNELEAALRIYGIDNYLTGIYFATQGELLQAIINNKINIWSNLVALEYFPKYAGKNDVIRKINKDGAKEILTVESTNELRRLDVNKSIEQGIYVWQIVSGNLRKEYAALKNFGIKFKENIYDQEDNLIRLHKRNLNKETFKN